MVVSSAQIATAFSSDSTAKSSQSTRQGHVCASVGDAQPDGRPSLKLKFDVPVAGKLRRLTHANLHKRLAILVHGKVVVAPIVRSELSDEAMITGTFSQEELQRLLKALSPAAGSPAAPNGARA